MKGINKILLFKIALTNKFKRNKVRAKEENNIFEITKIKMIK